MDLATGSLALRTTARDEQMHTSAPACAISLCCVSLWRVKKAWQVSSLKEHLRLLYTFRQDSSDKPKLCLDVSWEAEIAPVHLGQRWIQVWSHFRYEAHRDGGSAEVRGCQDMWAQNPSPTEGAEGAAAVACDAPRDALPDSSYTVVCVTPLKIKCKAASFKKLVPCEQPPLVTTVTSNWLLVLSGFV